MAGELVATYFPYTFLGESDSKRLSLYVSRLRLLQIDPQASVGLPAEFRARDFIQPVAPLQDRSTLERIRLALGSYRQLGAPRPDGSLLQSFSAFALQDDDVEGSTRRLRAHLRGSRSKPTPSDSALVDAAVFLLLAQEVDREHVELGGQLGGIRVLETKFNQALGLPDEHEEEPAAPEAPDGDDLEQSRSGQVLQRLRAWTRLGLAGEVGRGTPITTSVAVMEEVRERLPSLLAAMSPAASAAAPEARRLCRVPDPAALPAAEVFALGGDLERAGILQHWRKAVAATLKALQAAEPKGTEEVEAAAAAFVERWPTRTAADLEVQVISYPRLTAMTAFALATGLESPTADLMDPEGRNGVSLLFVPVRGFNSR
ncbi:MAG TPA: hypothetical protein VMU60_11835 [Syntrophobacteria bacterium]|nr:hypothetical protein [Syntrophobacteria bacterium]